MYPCTVVPLYKKQQHSYYYEIIGIMKILYKYNNILTSYESNVGRREVPLQCYALIALCGALAYNTDSEGAENIFLPRSCMEGIVFVACGVLMALSYRAVEALWAAEICLEPNRNL